MNNKTQQIADAFKVHGRQVPEGAKPPEGMRARDLRFVLGTVIHYDSRKHQITVSLFDGEGDKLNIPVSQPFAGTNSYIAGMPDIGSVVILARVQDVYILMGYYPTYEASLRGTYIKKWKDSIKVAGKNDYFLRFPRMAPGDVAMSSSHGPELYLDYDLRMSTGFGDELVMRTNDHSIVKTSINSYLFMGGVWSNAGIIYRNSLEESNVADGQFAVREINPEGKVRYPLIADNASGSAQKYYSEFLLEVEEQTEKATPRNDVNGVFNRKPRVPNAVFSMGNFVGNNSTKLDTYGKLLGVQLFKSPDDLGGVFNLTSLSGDSASDYGLAITLFKPTERNYNMGTLLGIDKEGHFYQYVRSASGGGLGKGRSMSILADGSKKEQYGQESSFGNSWDMTTSGGIRWIVGNHSARDKRYKEKSIDIRTTKGIFSYYGAPAEDLQTEYKLYEWDDVEQEEVLVNNTAAYKKIEVVNGKERSEVYGTKESTVTGNEAVRVYGGKTERVGGVYKVDAGSKIEMHTSDGYVATVSKEMQEKFGSRKTTITQGKSELLIDTKDGTGGISEQIRYSGNKELTIGTGSIKEKILIRGGKEFSTTTGDYKVSMLTRGNFNVKTISGDMLMNTKQGSLELKTKVGGANIESSLVANVKGSKIVLKGRNFIKGGIITDKTHQDYIVGSYLRGSKTVQATS